MAEINDSCLQLQLQLSHYSLCKPACAYAYRYADRRVGLARPTFCSAASPLLHPVRRKVFPGEPERDAGDAWLFKKHLGSWSCYWLHLMHVVYIPNWRPFSPIRACTTTCWHYFEATNLSSALVVLSVASSIDAAGVVLQAVGVPAVSNRRSGAEVES